MFFAKKNLFFFGNLILLAIALFLAGDFLGYFNLLKILSFLLLAVSVGGLIDRQTANSPLRLFFVAVLGMETIALVMLLCRLLSVPEAPFLLALGLAGFLALLFRLFKHQLFSNNKKTFSFLFSKELSLVLLAFLFGLLLVSDYMVGDGSHYYFQDDHHPVYELSIARAVDLKVPPPEISYLGKELKFHFGSSFLVSFFYGRLNIDPLLVVYRVFPFLALLIFIPLFLYLLKLSGVKRKFWGWGVICVLFASPFLLPIPPRFVGTHLLAFPDVLNWLTATPSFTMGFLGFLTLLIGILETIKKKSWLSFKIPILSAFAFFFKASFFIPLALAMGVWCFYYFWKTREKRALALFLSITIPAAPLFFFMAGAHRHEQWIFSPDRFIWLSKLPNSIAFLPIAFLFTPLFLFGFLALVYIFSFFCLFKNRQAIFNSTESMIILVMLVSCSFPLFICEITEAADWQFILSGFTVLWLILFRWLSGRNFSKKQKIIAGFLLALALISQQISFPKFRFDWVGLDKGNFELSCLVKLKSFISSAGKKESQTKPSYDFDLASALKFIDRHSAKNEVFLAVAQYPNPNWQERKYIGQIETGSFFRTALAGRQTVVENFKYRGICTEVDYNQRALENLKFYYLLVDHSLGLEKGWGAQMGHHSSVSRQEAIVKGSLVKRLLILPHYNWFDAKNSLPVYLEAHWSDIVGWDYQSEKSRQWLDGYLAKNKVGFVLFEKGEKPQEDLRKFLGLSLVFQQGSVSVYKKEGI